MTRTPQASGQAFGLRPLDIYVAALTGLGVGVVGVSAFQLPGTPHTVEWLLFTGLALLARRVALQIAGINARGVASDTFFMSSALLFGPGPATVAIAIDSLVMSYGRGDPLQRFLFNGSAPAIALWAGCQVFSYLLGVGSLFDSAVPAERVLLPLAALAAVYYLLNSGFAAVAVGWGKRTSAIDVWRGHFAAGSFNYFGAPSAAFFVFIVVHYAGVVALAAVILLLAVLPLAMRSWTGGLENATAPVAIFYRRYLSKNETPSTAGATAASAESADRLMALANLARIIQDGPTPADVGSVAWSHIRHVVPGATCGFFMLDPGSDSVVARFVAGPSSQVLQGLHMKVGERLTGWVAEHAQPIINSDAALDLGHGAALANVDRCLSVPLIHREQLVGVLSLYAAAPFDEEQAQTIQLVASSLGQMFAAVAVPTAVKATRPTLVRLDRVSRASR